MSADSRHDRLALALLLLLPTLLFADVLAGVANFRMRDLTRYYYPTKQIYAPIVAGGEFPLWNRYFQSGQPLAANPEHAIFYPFTWLTIVLPYDLGYRMHILVHIYIALLGMYALLRSMRAGPGAAFLGAASWGMGGLLLSYINLLPILFCAAWLPLTCLYVRRFLLERRARDFALAALFLGLQFLVAEPTTIAQTGFIIGMYGLYRGWHGRNTSDASTPGEAPLLGRLTAMLRNTGWIFLISVGGFAVGAVQMLAAIDHVGDSARSRPFTFELVGAWSMPWAKLIELVYPNFLGHVQLDGEIHYWGSSLYGSMGAPFLFSIYPGLAITALAAAGLACRIRGSGLTAALAGVSSLLALGDHTPLLRALYEAGIARSVRYPEKFILIGVFALTVFAARTCDRLLRGNAQVRSAAAGFALATALIAAAISLLGFTSTSIETWVAFFALRPDAETLSMIGTAWRDWSIAAGRGLVLFLLIIGVGASRRLLWWSAALLFLCADLGPAVHQLNPRLPSRFFTAQPEVVSTLHPGRSQYRVFHQADWFAGDQIGLMFPDSTARYWIARNGLFPAVPAGYGIQAALERDYDETSLLPTLDLIGAMWQVRRSGRPDWYRPFMAMSNAWYRGVIAERDRWLHRDFETAAPVRFEKGPHYPRYYLADQIVQISDRNDFVAKLSTTTFSDRVAFVTGQPFQAAGGRVIGVRERANSAAIEVEADGRAFLVMSVTAHKYWRVTIDGHAAAPVRVNIAYQGVEIPPGRHLVVMRYRNDVIVIGAVISAISVTLLLMLLVYNRRRTVGDG